MRTMAKLQRVGSESDPNVMGWLIAMSVLVGEHFCTQTIGAGALNQAVKAIAIARGYLASLGIDVRARPSFADLLVDEQERTSILLNVAVVSTKARATRPAPNRGPLRVGSRSDPNKVAGAVAGEVRERERATAQTIGAGALNQAVKAIAIAQGYLGSDADIWFYPAFVNVVIDGDERSGIQLTVEVVSPEAEATRPAPMTAEKAVARLPPRPRVRKRGRPQPRHARKSASRGRRQHTGPARPRGSDNRSGRGAESRSR